MTKRRVCLITNLPFETAEAKFALLKNCYDFVSTPSEAEYVVLDLVNPTDDFHEHLPKKEDPSIPVRPEARVPTLLYGTNEEIDPIKSSFNCRVVNVAFGNQPRMAPTPEALLDDLKWLEKMFPVTRTADIPRVTSRGIALVMLRGEECAA